MFPALKGLVSCGSPRNDGWQWNLLLSPGWMLYALIQSDAPYIYNIYHYTVLEHFTSAPVYQDVLRVARIEETAELDEFIQSHVFVVGPYHGDNHWAKENSWNI